MFWTELDSIVHRVPLKHHLFILMDANARTGVRTSEEQRKIVGAYGRDARANDSNGIALMQSANDKKLALVNTFFRRAIISDPDRRQQLTQLIISELKQSIPGGTVSSLATNFTGVLLSAAEKVVYPSNPKATSTGVVRR